jgi:predicted membrane protein
MTTNPGNVRASVPAWDRLLNSGPARALSFSAAGLFCLMLIGFPQLVITDGRPPNHGILLLGLWGMAAGFVHGIGFIPRHRLVRLALGPLAAWLLIGLGAAAMAGP